MQPLHKGIQVIRDGDGKALMVKGGDKSGVGQVSYHKEDQTNSPTCLYIPIRFLLMFFEPVTL